MIRTTSKLVTILTTMLLKIVHSENYCDHNLRHQIPSPSLLFYGRGEYLAKLHFSIEKSKSHSTNSPKPPHHILKFITGNSFSGKTDFVSKYVEKYQEFYDHVIWFDAHSKDSLTFSFLSLQRNAQLCTHFKSDQNPLDISKIIDQVYLSLSSGSTLLIFDNVPHKSGQNQENENFLLSFLPSLTTLPNFYPVVLIISQKLDLQLSTLVEDLETIVLDNFSQIESPEFILKKMDVSDYDRKEFAAFDAKILAQHLNGVPMALGMAVKFMTSTGTSIKIYTEILQSENEEMDPGMSIEYSTIQKVWDITRNELEDLPEGDYALDLLKTFVILSQIEFISEMLIYSITPLEGYKAVYDKQFMFSNTMNVLAHYGLVERRSTQGREGEPEVRCHKPIMEIVKAGMIGESRMEIKKGVVEKVEQFVKDIFEGEGNFQSYLPSLRCLEKFGVSLMDQGTEEVGEGMGILELILKAERLFLGKSDEDLMRVEVVVKYFKGKVLKVVSGVEREGEKAGESLHQMNRIEL